MRDPVTISCSLETHSGGQLDATLAKVAAVLRTIRGEPQRQNHTLLPAAGNVTAAGGGGEGGGAGWPSLPGGSANGSEAGQAGSRSVASATTPAAAIPRLNSYPSLPVSSSPMLHTAPSNNSSLATPLLASPLVAMPRAGTPPQQGFQHHPQPQQQHQPQQHQHHFHQLYPRTPPQTQLQSHPQPPSPQVPPVSQLLPPPRPAEPSVDWFKLIDISRPETAARDIGKVLDSAPPQTVVALAKQFTQPAQAATIAALSDPHRTRLRDAVLQNVLKALTTEEEQLQEHAAESADMLMALNSHNLVVMAGVLKTIHALLSNANTFRAGVAVLSRLIAQLLASESDLLELKTSISTLRQTVADGCAKHPSLAYERVYIEEHVGWRTPKATMHRLRTIATNHSRHITATAFLSSRDELVTGGWEGSVAAWQDSSAPAWKVELPFGYHPCSMDSNSKVNSIVVAGASPTGRPILRSYTADRGAWTEKASVTRDDLAVITCVKCTSSRAAPICAAGFDGDMTHCLSLMDGSCAVVRDIRAVHSDYVTCLASSTDNDNWVISGSRDTTVRVWDTRHARDKPMHSCLFHTGTITGIATYRDLMLVTSLDKSLTVWDCRALKEPIGMLAFDAPLLRVVSTPQATAVVASTTCLSLLTVHPLVVQDVVPGIVATELRASQDHSMVFATGSSSQISVLSLHFPK